MEYVKINSLWKRDPVTKKLIEGDYSCPEFGLINSWRVDEKVDGTNIRIVWDNKSTPEGEDGQLTWSGRTDSASIPPDLMRYLMTHLNVERMKSVFPDRCHVTLFGEGYGPKIQSGEAYSEEQRFILFDVVINRWWLKRDDMRDIAAKLQVPAVPDIGIFTRDQIVSMVKHRPLSRCSLSPREVEGVVVRSEPLMLHRDQKPIMWKLKCRDFDR